MKRDPDHKILLIEYVRLINLKRRVLHLAGGP